MGLNLEVFKQINIPDCILHSIVDNYQLLFTNKITSKQMGDFIDKLELTVKQKEFLEWNNPKLQNKTPLQYLASIAKETIDCES